MSVSKRRREHHGRSALVLGLVAGASIAVMAIAHSAAAAPRDTAAIRIETQGAPNGTTRHATVTLDRRLAPTLGARLWLDLGNEGIIAGTVTRVLSNHGVDRFAVHGRIDGSPLGDFLIAVNGGAIVGEVQDPSRGKWRFRVDAEGVAQLVARDPHRGFTCLSPELAEPGPGAPMAGLEPCDAGSEIDLLVLFTQDARSEVGGLSTMLAEIDWMVADANTALVNSQVDIQFRLVYARQIAVDENDLTLGRLTDPADGYMDEAHALRDLYGADQVALLRSGTGGVANGLRELEISSAATAFCVSGISSADTGVLAHELGHNLGACHAIGDGGGCDLGLLFPFSNGYRFVGNGATEWRTVMAYPPGVRIRNYSSPAIYFDGEPTGLPQDENAGADNAQTLRVASMTVAAFRCRDDTCTDLGLSATGEDCDGNGVPDACEIARGAAPDANVNDVLDACEPCAGDLDLSSHVGFDDIVGLLGSWGPCVSTGACSGDLDGDRTVGFGDFALLLGVWGECP